MATVERGALLIADITGYTTYLTGTDLEHSQDVLADLIGVLVERMRGVLHLAQLEGDAVFCYGHEGEIDGPGLLAVVESSYVAFTRRVHTIHRHSTCPCSACQLIPRLNLKFLTHHGEYIITEIAGTRQLIGSDVVLTHRLLKNSVTPTTGLRGYAFFTRACLERLNIDAVALAMNAHREHFDDIGDVEGYVHNLEARWTEEEERQVVYIPPGQGIAAPEIVAPAPPAVVWDYLTSPAKRPLWEAGITRVVQSNLRGVPGVGTRNHCMHGRGAFDEEILDWKPFRYYSERLQMRPLGTLLLTTELMPVEGGTRTRITTRLQHRGRLFQRLLMRVMRGQFEGSFRLNLTNLQRLVATIEEDAARWSLPTHEPTLPSVLAARREEDLTPSRSG